MELRDIMTVDIETCEPNAKITEVAEKMKSLGVGSIPVYENGELKGIVSDRDIVIRCVADGNIEGIARDVMTLDPVTGTPEMTVDEAKKLMSEYQIRRLPVLDNGKVVGIVSLGDLAVKHEDNDKAGDALTEISKPL
ncbi:CBS domain-containing protein [Fictibacillus nanhaiensis]|jgi:signal-transduction protein with cAMP-binding, CBS, and nucleotidyltransferase domain|uniref:CBS domain-containing protein n=1 Tax=Fictibacillus nanhaiensis TaxID=742169 RepID=UPI002040F5B8|nr:CBS domain-containing protein [Fictibacillus nanhaiensis]MCM3733072.1 CBS domain-containing protein [Fictibacillus nanhaiensis]